MPVHSRFAAGRLSEKRAAIRGWAQKNASKVDELGSLHEKVTALAR
jgi:hypothetical protein